MMRLFMMWRVLPFPEDCSDAFRLYPLSLCGGRCHLPGGSGASEPPAPTDLDAFGQVRTALDKTGNFSLSYHAAFHDAAGTAAFGRLQ
jgi:hypothetical protein